MYDNKSRIGESILIVGTILFAGLIGFFLGITYSNKPDTEIQMSIFTPQLNFIDGNLRCDTLLEEAKKLGEFRMISGIAKGDKNIGQTVKVRIENTKKAIEFLKKLQDKKLIFYVPEINKYPLNGTDLKELEELTYFIHKEYKKKTKDQKPL